MDYYGDEPYTDYTSDDYSDSEYGYTDDYGYSDDSYTEDEYYDESGDGYTDYYDLEESDQELNDELEQMQEDQYLDSRQQDLEQQISDQLGPDYSEIDGTDGFDMADTDFYETEGEALESDSETDLEYNEEEVEIPDRFQQESNAEQIQTQSGGQTGVLTSSANGGDSGIQTSAQQASGTAASPDGNNAFSYVENLSPSDQNPTVSIIISLNYTYRELTTLMR